MEVTTLSNIPQSMADYLETEKIYKELCKNITDGVTTQDMNSSTDKAVTPDDEITALLKQMNQILTPDEKESILDSSEERSVDVILKEAEDLIRSSTPLFLNMSSASSTKTTSASKIKLTSPLNVTQTISKMQEIHPDNPNNEQLNQVENKESNVIESDDSRNLSKSFQTKSSGLSNYSMSEANDMIFKNIVNKKKRKSSDNMKSKNNMAKEKPRDRLSISDLATPIIKEVKTVSTDEHNKNKFKNKKDNLIDEDVDQFLIGVGESDSSHEEQTINLKKKINILNAKLKEYESSTKDMKSEAQNLVTAQQKQLEMLEAELHSQEQLIAGYQRENHKLCQDMNAAKEQWKQKEKTMLEEKQNLQREVHGMMSASICESLKEQLKDAQETIVKLQLELATSKCTTKELELKCDRLQGDIILLESEVENYRGQIEEFNTRDNKAASTAVLATTSALSAQLSDARNVISRKDAEIVRLNTSLGTLRAELNKKHISNQSNQIYEVESLNVTISQLQAALSLERDHSKELNREKDSLVRETLDLRRQVRELELIVKRRNRSESQIPLSHRSERSDNKVLELEKELKSRQEALTILHSQLKNMQLKYEEHVGDIEERLKAAQLENHSLKTNKIENSQGPLRKKPAPKEDAHLMATIRGLKQELTGKDKEILKLHKELDDAKKTNKRLQKEREKQLNPNMPPKTARGGNLIKDVDKASSESVGSLSSAKNYNPLLYNEFQETMVLLRSENQMLQNEVKKLEEDLITMHGKRVHDLNALQADHDLEIARLLNEQAARQSQASGIAELQGQVYTQQVVINHLKQQLKQAEELKQETAMLRAERSHLEDALVDLKKNLDSLKSLQSPESARQESVLAMLENIKRNSEIREQKLQAIVRDLLSRTSQTGHCNNSCCEKLLDKNRQLCYYCTEMDKLLEPLREFRRMK